MPSRSLLPPNPYGDPGATYLPPNAEPELAPLEVGGFDPWDGGAIVDLPTRGSNLPADKPAPTPTPDSTLEARVEALEARVRAIEKVLADYL